MLQKIRLNTFETNSSSMHSLILINQDDYLGWKYGDTWFRPQNDKFYTKDDIVSSDIFKNYIKNYNALNELEKDKAFDDFMREYSNNDYAEFYSYNNINKAIKEVYNEDGHKIYAFSYYISG